MLLELAPATLARLLCSPEEFGEVISTYLVQKNLDDVITTYLV